MKYRELLDGSNETEVSALLATCLVLLLRRRLGERPSKGELIKLVGEIRASPGAVAVDPRLAERLAGSALGDGSVDKAQALEKAKTEIVLVGRLVEMEQWSEDELRTFLGQAWELAGDWLSSRRSAPNS